MTAVAAMTTMHEYMHEWTQKQRQPNEGAEHVRSVLGEQQDACDDDEAKEREGPAGRQKTSRRPVAVMRLVMMGHEALLFDDETAAEHAHRAGEGEFARFLGHELDRDGLARWQVGAFLEIGEDHLVGARRRFFAAEVEPHRTAAADDDGVGRIAPLHQDHGFLVAAGGFARAESDGTLEPEEPDDEAHQRDAGEGDEPTVRCHEPVLRGWKKRSRLALVTTVTELKAMAAAAISGDSSRPMNG